MDDPVKNPANPATQSIDGITPAVNNTGSASIPSNTYSDSFVNTASQTSRETIASANTVETSEPLATEPTESNTEALAPAPPIKTSTPEPVPSIPIQPSAEKVSPMSEHPAQPPHQHDLPVAAIVAAVIVALALSAATVFYYIRSRDDSIPENEQAGTTQSIPASISDIETATKALDDGLASINDDKDFASNDLSDATLGL